LESTEASGDANAGAEAGASSSGIGKCVFLLHHSCD
jgi:hypothetical protein